MIVKKVIATFIVIMVILGCSNVEPMDKTSESIGSANELMGSETKENDSR